MNQADIDAAMMRHCISLSATATKKGEFPFAAIVCDGAKIVAEATNSVAQDCDVTRHAELVAISKAQQVLGKKDLSGCAIYSNVEPCVMCSFPIRETRIARVIFAIRSPLMGGYSKWNLLRDTEISNVMPEAFGCVPETIVGLLQDEAEKVWRKWNPVIWGVIRYRGCFGAPHDRCKAKHASRLRLSFMRRAPSPQLYAPSVDSIPQPAFDLTSRCDTDGKLDCQTKTGSQQSAATRECRPRRASVKSHPDHRRNMVGLTDNRLKQ